MKLTYEYDLLAGACQNSIECFNQDSVDELIRLLEGRELFTVNRGRSDKLVQITEDFLIRKPVTLPLDYPETSTTKVERYILSNGEGSNEEIINLTNGIYRTFDSEFKSMVSVEVVLYHSPLDKIKKICETINDVYSTGKV